MQRQYYHEMDSPIGALTLVSDGTHLSAVHMRPGAEVLARQPGEWRESADRLAQPHDQLAAYFAGDLREFTLELAPRGTPFQQRVWAALTRIPFGATWSYGALAAAIGSPGHARAVGAANGQNPLAIIVPCHRVIGANGTLVGYGGGLERKRWLLEHEARCVATATQLALM
ncbi:MAG TPA: methylated-DNA--[protein]-cysteine S-methyltransferase [Longimicrobiales bacterium]|nr:methylated-DNA--[protein]-cysteine S-methyltransferase [Longimicrobiales bacterium]